MEREGFGWKKRPRLVPLGTSTSTFAPWKPGYKLTAVKNPIENEGNPCLLLPILLVLSGTEIPADLRIYLSALPGTSSDTLSHTVGPVYIGRFPARLFVKGQLACVALSKALRSMRPPGQDATSYREQGQSEQPPSWALQTWVLFPALAPISMTRSSKPLHLSMLATPCLSGSLREGAIPG